METRTERLEGVAGKSLARSAGGDRHMPPATEAGGAVQVGGSHPMSRSRRPRPALDSWLEQVEAVLATAGPEIVERFEHLCTIGRR